jgi:bifunctional non-homologous end joining protein LigD
MASPRGKSPKRSGSSDVPQPMLASIAPAPFRRPGWIFEIKWDGYRAIAEKAGSTVRLHSRNQNLLNDRYPAIARGVAQLEHDAILDGEIVVLDPRGVAQFGWLQGYPRYGGQLVYYVFDLLQLDGENLTELPLVERKRRLQEILPSASSNVRYCDHIETEGTLFFDAIVQRGVEGIVAKDGSSLYRPGQRTKNWLKIKGHSRQEAIVAAFTESEGAGREIGALVLGVERDGTLVHIGEVGTGFSDNTLKSIWNRLKPLVQTQCPFPQRPKVKGRVHWVRPTLTCEVKFHNWTIDGKLRHAVWMGFKDEPTSPAAPPTPAAARPARLLPPKGESVSVAGRTVKLTNLDKVYWPKVPFVKRDLLAYAREVAPFILPYLHDRPLSLQRFPDGVEGQSFFQKNVEKAPEWVQTVAVSHKPGETPINYALCQDEATLVYLANLGAIELHPWHSRTESLEHPDYIIIDLDPTDAPFQRVIECALTVRSILDSAHVECWCKTSGMTGLHIYVPLGAKYDYGQASQFAALVVQIVHQKLPQITSLERKPAKRQNLVYLDSIQNRRAQSIVSVYSPRSHPEGTVSTPLRWSEVNSKLDPAAFTIRTLGKRLAKVGDLWNGVLGPGIDMLDCLGRLHQLLQYRK